MTGVNRRPPIGGSQSARLPICSPRCSDDFSQPSPCFASSRPPRLAGEREAIAAYQAGDFATALRELQPLADSGNVTAQTILGFMYANGQGVAPDTAEAIKWFKLAAIQGSSDAQHNLGFIYDAGQGVPQDLSRSHKVVPPRRRAGPRGLPVQPRRHLRGRRRISPKPRSGTASPPAGRRLRAGEPRAPLRQRQGRPAELRRGGQMVQ